MVGVEGLARDDAPAVFDLVIGHVVDAGVAGDVALPLVVQLNFAEDLRRRLELIRRKVLVAHHQHVMFGEGAAQDGVVVGVDRLCEVEADDLDAGVSRQRCDGERRHRMTLQATGSSIGR